MDAMTSEQETRHTGSNRSRAMLRQITAPPVAITLAALGWSPPVESVQRGQRIVR